MTKELTYNNTITPARESELMDWLKCGYDDGSYSEYFETDSDLYLASIDLYILIYEQGLAKATVLPVNLSSNCMFCELFDSTCAGCPWQYGHTDLEACRCTDWLCSLVGTRSYSPTVMQFTLVRTLRLEQLYKWRDYYTPRTDGTIYCTTCNHETSISKIPIVEADDAYGQRTLFTTYEYHTCCGEQDVSYDPAGLVIVPPDELTELADAHSR